MENLTTTEAAERIGIPVSTLKTWLERLDVELPTDRRGRRLLDEKAIGVIETIKALRDEDHGYHTIRRIIGPADLVGGRDASADPKREEAQTNQGEATTVDTAAIVEAVTQAIGAQTDLAERFGRVAYELGEARATIKALEMERDRLNEELVASKLKTEAPNWALQFKSWISRITGN